MPKHSLTLFKDSVSPTTKLVVTQTPPEQLNIWLNKIEEEAENEKKNHNHLTVLNHNIKLALKETEKQVAQFCWPSAETGCATHGRPHSWRPQ